MKIYNNLNEILNEYMNLSSSDMVDEIIDTLVKIYKTLNLSKKEDKFVEPSELSDRFRTLSIQPDNHQGNEVQDKLAERFNGLIQNFHYLFSAFDELHLDTERSTEDKLYKKADLILVKLINKSNVPL